MSKPKRLDDDFDPIQIERHTEERDQFIEKTGTGAYPEPGLGRQ